MYRRKIQKRNRRGGHKIIETKTILRLGCYAKENAQLCQESGLRCDDEEKRRRRQTASCLACLCAFRLCGCVRPCGCRGVPRSAWCCTVRKDWPAGKVLTCAHVNPVRTASTRTPYSVLFQDIQNTYMHARGRRTHLMHSVPAAWQHARVGYCTALNSRNLCDARLCLATAPSRMPSPLVRT